MTSQGSDNDKLRLIAAINTELTTGVAPDALLYVGVQMVTHAAFNMAMPKEAVLELLASMLADNTVVPLGTVRH